MDTSGRRSVERLFVPCSSTEAEKSFIESRVKYISPAPGKILKVLEGSAKAIPVREKYSPRAACWYVAKMTAWYHNG